MVEPFETREQAGKELAAALASYRNSDSIVLAIPRGGVVVGYQVSESLGLELDVIVPRKIPAPHQPELAIGAVASWGDHERILDQHSVSLLRVSDEYIEAEVAAQLQEVNRRLLAYRGTSEPPNVAGRTVILVDDGVATGYTTRAAALALKNLDAFWVVLAVPVAPPDSLEDLARVVDDVVCLKTPVPFLAVGYCYRDFQQTPDKEVIELLRRSRSKNTS